MSSGRVGVQPAATYAELVTLHAETKATLAGVEAALASAGGGTVDALITGWGGELELLTLGEDSDRFFRTLVAAMQEGAASLDAGGTVLYANGRLGELLGVSLQRVVGRTLVELAAEASRPHVRRLLAQAARAPARGVLELVAADGRHVPVTVSAAALGAQRGELCLVVTDLSVQRRAEAEAERERAALAQAQAIARIGSWEQDLDTGETRWSAEQFRLHGLDPAAGAPRLQDYFALVHPDDRVALHVRVADHLRRRHEFVEEYRFEHPTLGARTLLIHGEFLQAEPDGGRAACVAGTCQDVTDQRAAQAVLLTAEERFRCSFDEARIGMLILDLDSRYERVNDAFCAIVGYSHEQLAGISRASITHPDDRAADAAVVRALLAGEARSHMCEKRYIHASGDVVWAAINLTLIRGADARPLHFIAQVQDVTERRNHEELLERQHQKLVEAQRVGGFGTWEWVAASDTIEWSDELCRMYGVKPGLQPTAAKKVIQCIHADDRVRLQARLQACLHSGEPLDLELRVVLPDGARRVAHTRGMVIADEAGVALRVVGTAQDITARYELERAKAEFVSIVSHELRTPLTCIHGALGLIKSGTLGTMPEGRQRMVDIALQNSDRLGRLINDILDVERIGSTEISMRRVFCNADDLIARATDAVASVAAAAGISVVVDAAPVPLSADSDRIIQMLTNLISNAVKFSPANSSVRVSCSGSDGVALFEVCDQGRGIPAEHLESIFERFRQVDASDSRQKGGTGLGLAICRSIVEQHGGRIWARSNPGDGATFSFTIPAPAVGQPGPARSAASD